MDIFTEAAPGTVGNPLASTEASEFLTSILGVIMYMSIPVIGLILVVAGFMFIAARGNREKLRNATYNITYIVAGIALVLGSYVIVNAIYNTVVKGILGWN